MVRRLLVRVQVAVQRRQMLVEAVVPHTLMLEVVEALHRLMEAVEVQPRTLAVVEGEALTSPQHALRRHMWFSLLWC
jgi:hypothetical protein